MKKSRWTTAGKTIICRFSTHKAWRHADYVGRHACGAVLQKW